MFWVMQWMALLWASANFATTVPLFISNTWMERSEPHIRTMSDTGFRKSCQRHDVDKLIEPVLVGHLFIVLEFQVEIYSTVYLISNSCKWNQLFFVLHGLTLEAHAELSRYLKTPVCFLQTVCSLLYFFSFTPIT